MKKLLLLALVAAFAGFAWLSLPSPDRAQTPGATQKVASGSGVVQGVDRDKGMVTIQHGPLPALNMMVAMTMSYAVRDRSQIANLQPLQKVEFQVAYDGSDYLITEIK